MIWSLKILINICSFLQVDRTLQDAATSVVVVERRPRQLWPPAGVCGILWGRVPVAEAGVWGMRCVSAARRGIRGGSRRQASTRLSFRRAAADLSEQQQVRRRSRCSSRYLDNQMARSGCLLRRKRPHLAEIIRLRKKICYSIRWSIRLWYVICDILFCIFTCDQLQDDVHCKWSGHSKIWTELLGLTVQFKTCMRLNVRTLAVYC